MPIIKVDNRNISRCLAEAPLKVLMVSALLGLINSILMSFHRMKLSSTAFVRRHHHTSSIFFLSDYLWSLKK